MLRRFFFALASAAPVAIRSVPRPSGNVQSAGYYPPPLNVYPPLPDVGNVAQSIYPPNWHKFEEAQRKAVAHAYKRYGIQNNAVSSNLRALKSISEQHRLHMADKEQERFEREHHSLLESLARQFDVFDFWKKQKDREYD